MQQNSKMLQTNYHPEMKKKFNQVNLNAIKEKARNYQNFENEILHVPVIDHIKIKKFSGFQTSLKILQSETCLFKHLKYTY